jgi:hypothetical protein
MEEKGEREISQSIQEERQSGEEEAGSRIHEVAKKNFLPLLPNTTLYDYY